MKNHVKLYLSTLGLSPTDFIPCEVCGSKAVDIHHIECRGMGGTDKDSPANLMALCRGCHVEYGDKKQYKEYLKQIHESYLFNILK
jgi:5-methylcytosine-specific restriction endonuclease McrA